MLHFLALGFLAFGNSLRAKGKGLNSLLWGFITITSMLFLTVTGGIFVVSTFCSDAIDLSGLLSFNAGQRMEASRQVQQAISGNMLHVATILLFTFGGYLVVRYRLEQEPDKKSIEAHLMDEVKEQ